MESALLAVESGTKIAKETDEAFQQVMETAKIATGLTNDIADALQLQEGAASEELAGQAQELKALVHRFQIKKLT